MMEDGGGGVVRGASAGASDTATVAVSGGDEREAPASVRSWLVAWKAAVTQLRDTGGSGGAGSGVNLAYTAADARVGDAEALLRLVAHGAVRKCGAVTRAVASLLADSRADGGRALAIQWLPQVVDGSSASWRHVVTMLSKVVPRAASQGASAIGALVRCVACMPMPALCGADDAFDTDTNTSGVAASAGGTPASDVHTQVREFMQVAARAVPDAGLAPVVSWLVQHALGSAAAASGVALCLRMLCRPRTGSRGDAASLAPRLGLVAHALAPALLASAAVSDAYHTVVAARRTPLEPLDVAILMVWMHPSSRRSEAAVDLLRAVALACRLPSRASVEAAVSAVSDPRLCHWCEPGLQRLGLVLVRMAGLAPGAKDSEADDTRAVANQAARVAVWWWAAVLRCVPSARGACLAVLGPWVAEGTACGMERGMSRRGTWTRDSSCARGLFAAEVLGACCTGTCADARHLALAALRAVASSVACVDRRGAEAEPFVGARQVMYRTAWALQCLLTAAGEAALHSAAAMHHRSVAQSTDMSPRRLAVRLAIVAARHDIKLCKSLVQDNLGALLVRCSQADALRTLTHVAARSHGHHRDSLQRLVQEAREHSGAALKQLLRDPSEVGASAWIEAVRHASVLAASLRGASDAAGSFKLDDDGTMPSLQRSSMDAAGKPSADVVAVCVASATTCLVCTAAANAAGGGGDPTMARAALRAMRRCTNSATVLYTRARAALRAVATMAASGRTERGGSGVDGSGEGSSGADAWVRCLAQGAEAITTITEKVVRERGAGAGGSGQRGKRRRRRGLGQDSSDDDAWSGEEDVDVEITRSRQKRRRRATVRTTARVGGAGAPNDGAVTNGTARSPRVSAVTTPQSAAKSRAARAGKRVGAKRGYGVARDLRRKARIALCGFASQAAAEAAVQVATGCVGLLARVSLTPTVAAALLMDTPTAEHTAMPGESVDQLLEERDLLLVLARAWGMPACDEEAVRGMEFDGDVLTASLDAACSDADEALALMTWRRQRSGCGVGGRNDAAHRHSLACLTPDSEFTGDRADGPACAGTHLAQHPTVATIEACVQLGLARTLAAGVVSHSAALYPCATDPDATANGGAAAGLVAAASTAVNSTVTVARTSALCVRLRLLAHLVLAGHRAEQVTDSSASGNVCTSLLNALAQGLAAPGAAGEASGGTDHDEAVAVVLQRLAAHLRRCSDASVATHVVDLMVAVAACVSDEHRRDAVADVGRLALASLSSAFPACVGCMDAAVVPRLEVVSAVALDVAEALCSHNSRQLQGMQARLMAACRPQRVAAVAHRASTSELWLTEEAPDRLCPVLLHVPPVASVSHATLPTSTVLPAAATETLATPAWLAEPPPTQPLPTAVLCAPRTLPVALSSLVVADSPDSVGLKWTASLFTESPDTAGTQEACLRHLLASAVVCMRVEHGVQVVSGLAAAVAQLSAARLHQQAGGARQSASDSEADSSESWSASKSSGGSHDPAAHNNPFVGAVLASEAVRVVRRRSPDVHGLVLSLSFDSCCCFYSTLLRLSVRLVSLSSCSYAAAGGMATSDSVDARKAGTAACQQVSRALRLFADLAAVAGPCAEGRLLDDDCCRTWLQACCDVLSLGMHKAIEARDQLRHSGLTSDGVAEPKLLAPLLEAVAQCAHFVAGLSGDAAVTALLERQSRTKVSGALAKAAAACLTALRNDKCVPCRAVRRWLGAVPSPVYVRTRHVPARRSPSAQYRISADLSAPSRVTARGAFAGKQRWARLVSTTPERIAKLLGWPLLNPPLDAAPSGGAVLQSVASTPKVNARPSEARPRKARARKARARKARGASSSLSPIQEETDRLPQPATTRRPKRAAAVRAASMTTAAVLSSESGSEDDDSEFVGTSDDSDMER